MKNFFFKHKVVSCLILIVLVSFPTYFNLLRGGFFTTQDDVQVMRLFEMDKCFADWQIPCRWAPDMGAGYGHPLFNYHPVLVYYAGALFGIFLSYILTVKLLFFLGLIMSGFFMFLLVREFFGDLAGFIAAIYFIYAPYHSVDLFVRGDLTELWGIMFFPLILWSLYKFISGRSKRWFFLSIISLSFLYMVHNIMAILFAPVIGVWVIVWMIKYKFKGLLPLILIFVWSVALAAFFVFPSIFEQSFLNIIQKSGYWDFHNHFVSVYQLLFDRSFNYGGSGFGSIDHLSFQIGWPYWILSIIFGVGSFIMMIRKKKKAWILFFMAVVFAAAVFMTHSRSVFVWESFSWVLSFVQFPWRFLGLAIFAASFLIGGFLSFFKGNLKFSFGIILLVLAVVLNAGYFHPQKFLPSATDKSLLSGDNYQRQSMSTLLDYVPVGDNSRVMVMAPSGPVVKMGQGSVSNFTKYSNKFDFDISVNSAESVIEAPIFYFPNWKVFLNNQPAKLSVSSDLGLIDVLAPQGSYHVEGRLENTPLRTASNFVSLASALVLVFYALFLIRKSTIIKAAIKNEKVYSR